MPNAPMSKQKAAANLAKLVSDCSGVAATNRLAVAQCESLLSVLKPAQRGVVSLNSLDFHTKLDELSATMTGFPQLADFQERLNTALNDAHETGLLVANRKAGFAR